MDQNITTPLPLPYCHLCKILMFIFLSVFPLVGIHADQGLYLNVIVPCIIAVAMFGIESISMEIEDPEFWKLVSCPPASPRSDEPAAPGPVLSDC